MCSCDVGNPVVSVIIKPSHEYDSFIFQTIVKRCKIASIFTFKCKFYISIDVISTRILVQGIPSRFYSATDAHILVWLKDKMVAQNDTCVSCIPEKFYLPNGSG